jgi:hypothetical protein
MLEIIKLSLENVFQALKVETNTMDKQDYIPLLITFFQEITNGGKLCLPLRLEPTEFRLTWEMICAGVKFCLFFKVVFHVLSVSSNWIPASYPQTTR